MRINLIKCRNLSIILLILSPFLSGCATLALSALGAGAGIGIPYVMADCADRTLNYPYSQVNHATPLVLQKLDITLIEKVPTEKGERIRALASEINIIIDIQQITPKATRVTVNATKKTVVKDKATAEEIISQLEKMLANKKGA